MAAEKPKINGAAIVMGLPHLLCWMAYLADMPWE
jgi:hypothetical protein